MNTVAQIRDVIYGYLQKTTTLEKAELTVGSMDLVLVALNNARKFAEMAHDWSFAEVECFVTTSSRTLILTPDQGNTAIPDIVETDTFALAVVGTVYEKTLYFDVTTVGTYRLTLGTVLVNYTFSDIVMDVRLESGEGGLVIGSQSTDRLFTADTYSGTTIAISVNPLVTRLTYSNGQLVLNVIGQMLGTDAGTPAPVITGTLESVSVETVTSSVTVWDANWRTAISAETGNTVNVRAWRDWALYFQGVKKPLDVNTRRGLLDREMEQKRKGKVRYQGATDTLIRPGKVEVVISGSRVSLVPDITEATVLYFDGYQWLDDYDSDSDTDFFIKHGSQYMLWSALCELNKLVKQWVPRQEGNLSEPTKERDTALEALIRHDKAVIDNYKRVRPR